MISAGSGDSELMSHINPDPEPERTSGLEPGGGVPPGETPPAESSMPEAGPRETHNPPKGWAKGPLTLIIVLAVLVAAFFLAYALTLIL
ncbi:Putative membrane protein OS=Streptomyces glaucescens OX=1907 GN=SGLAU_02555 PE=4 SV=1 [Streptomyces glaucescens]